MARVTRSQARTEVGTRIDRLANGRLGKSRALRGPRAAPGSGSLPHCLQHAEATVLTVELPVRLSLEPSRTGRGPWTGTTSSAGSMTTASRSASSPRTSEPSGRRPRVATTARSSPSNYARKSRATTCASPGPSAASCQPAAPHLQRATHPGHAAARLGRRGQGPLSAAPVGRHQRRRPGLPGRRYLRGCQHCRDCRWLRGRQHFRGCRGLRGRCAGRPVAIPDGAPLSSPGARDDVRSAGGACG